MPRKLASNHICRLNSALPDILMLPQFLAWATSNISLTVCASFLGVESLLPLS